MSDNAAEGASWRVSDSPFASLIGTNHVPTRIERNTLDALLIDPQLELSRLQSEMRRIQTELEGVARRKQEVEEYIVAHRALASLERQLPPEILAEVFAQCLPKYGTRDLDEAPLVLTRVCRNWRQIALGTPRLWTSLHVYLPPNLSDVACSQRIEGVTAWLERSGSLPIRLSFHGSTDLTRAHSYLHHVSPIPPHLLELTQKNMASMIGALLRFSHRFGQVFLSLSSANFSNFASVAPSTFPLLTSLRLQAKDRYIESLIPLSEMVQSDLKERSQFIPLLAGAPLLRKFRIDSFFGKDYDSLNLPCNWSGLSTLTIKDYLTTKQVVNLLAETPHLRLVDLNVVLGDCNSIPHPTVHLPYLVDFRLNLGTGILTLGGILAFRDRSDFRPIESGFKALLACIQFSDSLTSYSLSTSHSSLSGLVFTDWPIPLKTPFYNLETLQLAISLGPESMPGLSECLSQCHNLVTFRDLSGQLTDTHYAGLTLSSENLSPWCPKLENLKVSSSFNRNLWLIHTGGGGGGGGEGGVESTMCSSSAVTEFIRSRCWTTPTPTTYLSSSSSSSSLSSHMSSSTNSDPDSDSTSKYPPAPPPSSSSDSGGNSPLNPPISRLKSCSIRFPSEISFTQTEVDTLKSLQKTNSINREGGGLKLRLSWARSTRREEADFPDSGLRTSDPFLGSRAIRGEGRRVRIRSSNGSWDDDEDDIRSPFGSVEIV
ncbi:hypothetical protein D9757_007311 [Collybiopsis confluens]|uniref:F-box domain-containing protein n=1 Tax=Collybiopsis confluens TaxID=2823264 RepID=A0A8H5M6T9_9AGAR|nr:hypothetical protein D9757_007311 [Collybiopsis confluens]